VVAGGEHIKAQRQQFLADGWSDAKAARGIFGVCNGKVDVFVVQDERQVLGNEFTAHGGEDIADEEDAHVLINAAGAHAYHIARLAGLELPIVPVRHAYFITVPTGGIRPEWPCLRVPDATLYGRPDVNALLLGGWEPQALSADPRGYPLTGEPPPLEPDWPVLANFAELLAPLYPPVLEAGVRHVFRGWPTFTPDGRFIVGPSRRVRGFVMAGGCNAHGVSGSAGIGRHVVEALLEPRPSSYVRSLSPDRFVDTSWDWSAARRQARGIYETYYHIGH
jgi:glycine/D-amino acid oxidase-like deaminating enzyme